MSKPSMDSGVAARVRVFPATMDYPVGLPGFGRFPQGVGRMEGKNGTPPTA
ncbi:hypothetical protein [Ramlibacter lithotrophicus]|uniref:hypothetical protein n=1 Tax=Ramlibacter lithotrophicus TaxID=2606681 RepID=UPI0014392FD9|nr:hypothetical protein [Ramlibacter lithotrophicus]